MLEDCKTEWLATLWVVGKSQVSGMKVKRKVLILSIQKKGEGIGKMGGEGRFYEGGDG